MLKYEFQWLSKVFPPFYEKSSGKIFLSDIFVDWNDRIIIKNDINDPIKKDFFNFALLK